jgi:tetratricopeptide (TPR) repeat protein
MWRFTKALGLACALLLSAAQPAASQGGKQGEDDEWSRHLNAGNRAVWFGRHAEAEPHYREAIRAAEKFGEEDGRLWVSLRSLGLILVGLGEHRKDHARLDEGERIFLRLLGLAERRLDPEATAIDEVAREVLIALENLARVEEARGRFPETEAYLRRTLKIQLDRYRRRGSGQNARAYGASVNQLANFLCRRGMYAAARAVDKKFVPDCVLEAEEKAKKNQGRP